MRIYTSQSIQGLLAKQGYLDQANSSEINLDLPFLTSAENKQESARLNKLSNACGCGAGAVASFVGLLFYFYLVHFESLFNVHSVLWLSIYGALWFFVSGLLGKVVSLYISRKRLRYILITLLRKFDAQ